MTAAIIIGLGFAVLAVYAVTGWLWWPLPFLLIGLGCALEIISLRWPRRPRGPVQMVEFQPKGNRGR